MTTCEAETEHGRIQIPIPQIIKNLLKPKQRIWSPFVRKMVDHCCLGKSFRESAELVNAFLHRDNDDDRFSDMYIYDAVQQDGSQLEKDDVALVDTVFEETEWINKDPQKNEPVFIVDKVPESIKNPVFTEESRQQIKEQVEEAWKSFNEAQTESEQIQEECLADMIKCHPADTLIIQMDSIVIPHQKEHRNVNGVTDAVRDTKKIGIANGTIISAEGTYAVTASTEEEVCQRILACCIKNNLLANRAIIFFADGAKSLRKLADKYFGFQNFDYYLDWYHLWKKTYEFFSMALYGGKENRERNASIRYSFFKILWAGNVDEAIMYLENLDNSIVKSKKQLQNIIDYIGDNKRDTIYSYALRRELGLVNSSNRVEKQNDIAVASRCKDCSSSWTDDGALHIAQLRLMFKQKQNESWYQTREKEYTPIPLTDKLRSKMMLS